MCINFLFSVTNNKRAHAKSSTILTLGSFLILHGLNKHQMSFDTTLIMTLIMTCTKHRTFTAFCWILFKFNGNQFIILYYVSSPSLLSILFFLLFTFKIHFDSLVPFDFSFFRIFGIFSSKSTIIALPK